MRRVGPAVMMMASWILLAPIHTALASGHVVKLEPSGTKVSFMLKATGHDVEGDFELTDGEIRFDPATGQISGVIEVDARKGETGNNKRDKTMHKKVLESDEYPLFVYRVERMEGTLNETGSSDVTLYGTMTVHGQNHPLAMPTKIEIRDGHVTARATFPVPFVEWGMEDPSFLFLRVAKIVDVVVATEGRIMTETTDSLSKTHN